MNQLLLCVVYVCLLFASLSFDVCRCLFFFGVDCLLLVFDVCRMLMFVVCLLVVVNLLLLVVC